MTFLLIWLQELLDLVDWIQVTLEDDVEMLADSSSDKQYSYLSRMFRWLKRLLPNVVEEPYTADSMVGSYVHETTAPTEQGSMTTMLSCGAQQLCVLDPRRCIFIMESHQSSVFDYSTVDVRH